MGRTFGERLRSERLGRRLTRSALGGDLFRAREVGRLESGRREPPSGAVRVLADRLAAAPGASGAATAGTGPEGSLFLELSASQAWDERDYSRCRAQSLAGALAALAEGDPQRRWNLSFLAAACLCSLRRFRDCIDEALLLADHPLAAEGLPLRPRAETLLATACQGAGRLPEAVAHARRALRLGLAARLGPEILMEIYEALVSALSECGLLEEAWSHCTTMLIPLLESASDPQVAGKGLWTVGGVAFRRGDNGGGLRYHRRAASLLTPEADLEVWAAFNRDSALLRLSAGIHDADVLASIEHAEAALSVVGASETGELEELEIRHLRGRWLQLAGDHAGAAARLAAVYARRELFSPQSTAEVALHLGLSLAALGEREAAVGRLRAGARIFRSAGAADRADHAFRLAADVAAGGTVSMTG